MRSETRQFWIETVGLPGALMKVASTSNKPTPSLLVGVDADRLRGVKVFVTLPKEAIAASRTNFNFRVTSLRGAETTTTPATFESPERP